MSMPRALTSMLLVLFVSAGGFAQSKPQWVSETERVFRQKEPKWTVEWRNTHDSPHNFKQDWTFRSGKLQASVSISGWKNLKDTQDVFGAENLVLSRTEAGRRVKRKLRGLGDEGYIWTHPGSNLWPTIRFRKGNVYIDIFAPSVAIAKRFAQHIAEQIPAI